jgi:hypothetical protein
LELLQPEHEDELPPPELVPREKNVENKRETSLLPQSGQLTPSAPRMLHSNSNFFSHSLHLNS